MFLKTSLTALLDAVLVHLLYLLQTQLLSRLYFRTIFSPNTQTILLKFHFRDNVVHLSGRVSVKTSVQTTYGT
jgi:hypothetical protein